MKQVKMLKLPDCQFCGKVGAYDAKMKNYSSWACFCESCYKAKADKRIPASRLVLMPPQQEATGKTVKGIILTSMEDMIFDSVIEVECPECQEVRTMEPDSTGYLCTCGCRVKYSTFC